MLQRRPLQRLLQVLLTIRGDDAEVGEEAGGGACDVEQHDEGERQHSDTSLDEPSPRQSHRTDRADRLVPEVLGLR